MDTPNTQIHDRPLFCLGTGASMKKDGRLARNQDNFSDRSDMSTRGLLSK
jgi:hypothetical protein